MFRKALAAGIAVVTLAIFLMLAAFLARRIEDPPPERALDQDIGKPREVQFVEIQNQATPIRYSVQGFLAEWERIEITTENPGRIVEQNVAAGQPVKEGDVLFQLDSGRLQADLEAHRSHRANAEEDVQAARARLQRSEDAIRASEARVTQVEESHNAARSGVDKAKGALELAQTEASRLERLYRSGGVSKSEWENAQNRSRTAGSALAEAESSARSVEAQIEEAKAALTQAQASKAECEAHLRSAEESARGMGAEEERIRKELGAMALAAPRGGIVESVFTRKGELASAGRALAELIDLARLRVVVQIDPWVRDALREGDSVLVDVPDLGEVTLPGTVSRLGSRAHASTHKVQLDVEIPNQVPESERAKLPSGFDVERPYPIRPGYQVRCRFESTRTREVMEIERSWSFLSFSEVFVYVLVPIDKEYEGREVYRLQRRRVHVTSPPFRYDVYYIASGLSPGEKVVASDNAELSDNLAVVAKPR